MLDKIRLLMEGLNSAGAVTLGLAVILLLVYAGYCFRTDGWQAHVKLALGMAVVFVGVSWQSFFIVIWHRAALHGHPIPLDVRFYLDNLPGRILEVAGGIILLRVLTERYFGWPMCALMIGCSLAAAAALVVLP